MLQGAAALPRARASRGDGADARRVAAAGRDRPGCPTRDRPRNKDLDIFYLYFKIWRLRKYHHGEIVLKGSFSHVSKPIFQVDIHVAAFSGPTMFAHLCTAPGSNVART